MSANKDRGFLLYQREVPPDQPVEERIHHFQEFSLELPKDKLIQQACRCMNCGVPFCHQGCPLGNIIPDFNRAVQDERWDEALQILNSTNNFPEITGRVCPATCEAACCLAVTDPAVTIKYIEKTIADRGFKEGRIRPQPPVIDTGKTVAIIGSGPAGLAAAQQLRRVGHRVVVYERSDTPGGLLTYGIPDFKLEKQIVARRISQLEAEGVIFNCNTSVGKDIDPNELLQQVDAMLLTIGSTKPRDLKIPGRDLKGIYFAMDFLTQQNRRIANRPISGEEILATGKRVVILGGGDTGADCHGTSIRQGAAHVVSIELLPKPPEKVNPATPWPLWPNILRTSTSHQEGGERMWSVMTKSFLGKNGHVCGIQAVQLEWSEPDIHGKRTYREIPGSTFQIDCELVLLALGFEHPEDDIPNQLGLERDQRGNIVADYSGPRAYQTSREKVFVAGDARRGQSLVVWAIHEGREAARAIDLYLMGHSSLPTIFSYGYEDVAPELIQ